MNLFVRHSHDLERSVSLEEAMIESAETDEGDIDGLDNDVLFDIGI